MVHGNSNRTRKEAEKQIDRPGHDAYGKPLLKIACNRLKSDPHVDEIPDSVQLYREAKQRHAQRLTDINQAKEHTNVKSKSKMMLIDEDRENSEEVKENVELMETIEEKYQFAKLEKMKEVKARLNLEGCSKRNSKVQEVPQHSESRTPNVRGEHRRGRRIRRSCSMSGSPERTSVFSRIRRDRSESPRHRLGEKEEETEEYSIGWEIKEKVCSHTQKAVTRVTAWEERNPFPENVTMKEHVHGGHKCSPKVKIAEGNTGSQNQKSKGSTRVWFDDLPPKSIDSYDDLKKAFLANFLQQKKCIKDPVEIHHIKQREGEFTKDFVQRFKAESRHVKGAPREDFRNQQRLERRRDKFTLLTKSSKEILAPDKGKFKAPPPMTTPWKKETTTSSVNFMEK
ncbi:reverse transcriptase domain-containing protein [Tanacetum coccineum]